MSRLSYIFSCCFWTFITAYVLLVCSFSVGYFYCFLPSVCAGVLSAVAFPLITNKLKNNMTVNSVVAIALHIIALVVSAVLLGFSGYGTYADTKAYLLLIVLPCILSLSASLLTSYPVLRMEKIKDFFYRHEKLFVAAVLILAVIVIAVLAVRPFSKIMVVLMPF